MTQKVLLTILDGWGYTPKNETTNAIEVGNTTYWKQLVNNNPKAFLTTFGIDVGLPEGQMGNSEVGHTNIGAGRVVYQDLPKINKAMAEDGIKDIAELQKSIALAKQNNSAVHIMGLYSNGGVHSSYLHYLHCAEIFAKNNINVYLHIFTDGRDTPPSSAINFLPELDNLLAKYSNIKVATICGRYYAMDRDNRWERIEKAYNCMVNATAEYSTDNLKDYLEQSYNNKINDEFIEPAVFSNYSGMQNNDIICIINFRNDRARQILNALLLPNFNGFNRTKTVNFACAVGMVEYSDELAKNMLTLFAKKELKNTLGEWIAKQGLKQLRVAETEKYPHVTFFFNGGQETPFTNEDRILVPSPKVATYDLQPEMSAFEITNNVINAMQQNNHNLIVVNYANGDMVGHTGSLTAAAKATEAVDNCLQKLHAEVINNNYIWLIIADHGNCEEMWDYNNNVAHTQHTTNLVYCILTNYKYNNNITLQNGKLADVAVTVLDLLNLEKPKEMDGCSLLKK